MNETTDLHLLAGQVKSARMRRGWSKEKAAREAKVSSITWKRVEDGLPVQDTKRTAIMAALQLEWRDAVFVDNSHNLARSPGGLIAMAGLTEEELVESNAALHERVATLRGHAEQSIAKLQQEAERQAAEMAGDEPAAAAALLTSIARTVTAIRQSVERTVLAMVHAELVDDGEREDFYASDPDVLDAMAARALDPMSAGRSDEEIDDVLSEARRRNAQRKPEVLPTAAREVGQRSAGQRRRAEADQAGEPPTDDPDDLEPR